MSPSAAVGAATIDDSTTSSTCEPASTVATLHVGGTLVLVNETSPGGTVLFAPSCQPSKVWPAGKKSRNVTASVSRAFSKSTCSRQHTRSPAR